MHEKKMNHETTPPYLRYQFTTCNLVHSTKFTMIFAKICQIGSKILEISSNFTPCFQWQQVFMHFSLLPQLNSARSSRHIIFCQVERAKQNRCKRWRWSEKKAIYQNLRVIYALIWLHVQRCIRVDVGLVFGVKINLYLKIKYTFEIFHQPAVKLYVKFLN